MIVVKFFKHLRKNGPLGTLDQFCNNMQNDYFKRFPLIPGLFSLFRKQLFNYQLYFDSKFDRRYGTNTSGIIPIKELKVESKNTELAIWYEPMSEKVFNQFMNKLNIIFDEFDFIDFGSGKGRVLLMASTFGFRKIIGVEFAQELHKIAVENIRIFQKRTKQTIEIEAICEDATNFPIPDRPLVLFFYSPFKGKVMEQVLTNISRSFNNNPRTIILIFYGDNPESIRLMKSINFSCDELKLHPDWTRLKNYNCFLFTGSLN